MAGRYTNVEPMGATRPGHFSLVFRAEDTRSGLRVALKFMNPFEVEYRRQSFQREAKVCELMVGKENIIQLAGGVEELQLRMKFENGALFPVTIHYFAVELAKETYAAYLFGRRRPRPAYRRIEVLLDAIKGLGRLHRHGYCHRDVKPDNILLFSRGVAKVADLGTCRLHSGADPLPAADYTVIRWAGDAAYTAPEILAGGLLNPSLLVGADWFSVGSILFEALSGRPLYVTINLQARENIVEILKATADLSAYTGLMSSAVTKYAIPALHDFDEPWLRPLRPGTVGRLTALVRDLANFDYRRRETNYERILHRMQLAISACRLDHDRACTLRLHGAGA